MGLLLSLIAWPFFTKETPAETSQVTCLAYNRMSGDAAGHPDIQKMHRWLQERRSDPMTALLVLILVLALLGGGGFVINALWYVLVAALLLWLIGFFVGGTVEGRRRWYNW